MMERTHGKGKSKIDHMEKKAHLSLGTHPSFSDTIESLAGCMEWGECTCWGESGGNWWQPTTARSAHNAPQWISLSMSIRPLGAWRGWWSDGLFPLSQRTGDFPLHRPTNRPTVVRFLPLRSPSHSRQAHSPWWGTVRAGFGSHLRWDEPELYPMTDAHALPTTHQRADKAQGGAVDGSFAVLRETGLCPVRIPCCRAAGDLDLAPTRAILAGGKWGSGCGCRFGTGGAGTRVRPETGGPTPGGWCREWPHWPENGPPDGEHPSHQGYGPLLPLWDHRYPVIDVSTTHSFVIRRSKRSSKEKSTCKTPIPVTAGEEDPSSTTSGWSEAGLRSRLR